MSTSNSDELIVKQICSGVLSGGVVGVLFGRGERLLSYLTFSSIGLLEFAYHYDHFKAHLTHLSYDQRTIRSRFQRFQREFRQPQDDFQWIWNDLKRYIEQHAFYGMGFTIAFLISVVLVPKRLR